MCSIVSLLFDFATRNLHFATNFYHLVAKWRLNDFVNFEPWHCGSKLSLDSKCCTVLFFRINADENDLPWELYISQYPSFLFFPAYRYSEFYLYCIQSSIKYSEIL